MSSLLNTIEPKSRKGAPRDAVSLSREGRCGLALRELEATSRLGAAILLTLDHAAVPGEVAVRLQRRAEPGLVIGERLADAVAERAGLAREPAAVHRADDVVLADPVRHREGLVDYHAQHRPREIDRAVAVVDGDLAGARLQPHPGHRVLALASGI